MNVPHLRLRVANAREVDPAGQYVLYWMVAYRRTNWNFSLQRAVEWARDLKKPLVVFEALRCGYRWASDRLHQFVIQGMADNARRIVHNGVHYYCYLEPQAGAGKGLLEALAGNACVVVSDDYPCFFLPRMIRAAADRMPVRFELVDSNGLLPLAAANKVFSRAFDFRRFLQKSLRPHLDQFPEADPLENLRLPKLEALPHVERRWPAAEPTQLADTSKHLADLPIDHRVGASPLRGGWQAAARTFREFLETRLARYENERNVPDVDVASGLSPYLHFGHISAHQVFAETMQHDGWSPESISGKVTGSARDWWGASPAVESFVDELVTWREVGFNMCRLRDDYDRYESLPDWARQTLAEHAGDRREHVYRLNEFEAAETHDELWNAAQRQLTREGKLHNYLRMLWGKKILEWTASPRDALEVMIELNNKYALDGRDPNSYSGIFWVLGRYDRAWGPERPVFGKIRYMSSENTARKVSVKRYLERYAAGKRTLF